jgi:predicted small metal-binding protein
MPSTSELRRSPPLRGARAQKQQKGDSDGTGCTLRLSGEEEHVVQAAAEHAVSVHGQEDSPELREWLHNNLKDEAEVAHA